MVSREYFTLSFRERGAIGMHTPLNPETPEPPARVGSSLITLSVAAQPQPASANPDDVPTYVGPRRTAMAEALALAPGYRLGHYEIVESIGAGGMAAVLKARDLELGRLVALKILPPEAARDTESVTRFKQEARAAARLDHDNIARVFFCGEDRGLNFIAFEYVEGDTLRALIDRLGTVSPADCVSYMLHVCAGLTHATERGVVHRDIKPSNIVITPDGRAKIIDMGLARHHESQSVNGGVTHSGVTLGTFDYISPEQALDPRKADVRSDIYSMGCTFYHALTGRPPINPGTAAYKLQAQQNESPLDPRLLNSAIPDELAIVLSRMMAKSPAKRYQNPAELVADLVPVAQLLNLQTPEAAAFAMATPRFGSGELPRLTLGIVFGIAMVIIASVVIWGATTANTAKNDVPLWAQKPAPIPPFTISTPLPAPQPIRAPNSTTTVKNAEELLAALQLPNPHIVLSSGVTYDLSQSPGVLVNGQNELILECLNPNNPATIILGIAPINPEKPGALRPETLTVSQTERIRFRGIRFEIGDPIPEFDGSSSAVSIQLQNIAKVELLECQFTVQADVPTASAHLFAIARTGPLPTELSASHCFFNLRRWSGWEFNGPVKANFQHCAAATSRSFITVGNDALTPANTNATLNLRQCSIMLEKNATVLQVAAGARCTTTVGYCLFAAPNAPEPNVMMLPEMKEIKASIVRSAQDQSELVTVSALPEERNAVYRVELPTGLLKNTTDLPASPWASSTPQSRLNRNDEPWKAFLLNTTQRLLRDDLPSSIGLLGAQYVPFADIRIYDQWPPSRLASESPKPGVRVWWPNAPREERDALPKQIYDNLATAITELRPGEELHIRGNGIIEVPAIPAFNKTNLRIIIKAEEGSAPILVPAKSERVDVSMFRLEEGELRLEGLQFDQTHKIDEDTDLRTASIVTIAGGRRCEFQHCVISMNEQFSEKLAVVSIQDVSAQMRKPETLRAPEITFENCLIRGRGRALAVPSAMPLNLRMTNSAIVLNGSLLELGGPPKTPPSGVAISTTFTHITALLNGPLLNLKPSEMLDDMPAPWIPVEVRAEASLFLNSETEPQPLVQIQPADPSTPERYFTWQTTGNVFANAPKMHAFLTMNPGDGREPKLWDSTEWLNLTKEKATSLHRIVLQKLPLLKNYGKVQPDDLTVKDSEPALSSRDVGAALNTIRKPRE